MKSILKDTNNSEKLLNMVSDTLILMDKDGVCVDIAIHNVDLWFIKEKRLLGKNLLSLLPSNTYREFYPEFKKVLLQKTKSIRNYELTLRGRNYFFKCIMQPYGDLILCQYRDITERSQRKLELERKNRELFEIQKAALIGRWIYNANAKEFSYSGQTGIMCTEAEQSILLSDYLNFILPEDRDSFSNWLVQNLKGNMEESIDYRISLDKKVFYIRLKAFTRERYKDGNVTLEGYIQNITDIQQRRNDINLLTHAINNSTEDIFAAHEDGTLIFANRQFKLHHNLNNTDDITQLKIYEIDSYVRNEEEWKKLAVSIKNGEKKLCVTMYNPLPLYPEILAYESNAYCIISDEGEGTIWAFGRDISQRIKHEQQIKRFSQILDKTIEYLPAGIVVKDIKNNFKYLYRNRESYNREITMQEALGKDDFDFYPLEIAQEKRRQDIEIAATGQEMHWITEERDGNGQSLFLDKRKMKIESNDFSPILLNIEWDITDMELMKRELMVAKEKAETSDQLKSAFLANMSHEIRTPLNAIVGFSELLVDCDDPAEKTEYWQIIESNNELLLQLINDILDLSKIESGILERKRERFNLTQVCNELYSMMLPKITNPEVELRLDNSQQDCWILLDRNRLRQVWMNFVTNAVKYTKSGYIKIGYTVEKGGVRIYVEDTGAGIREELKDRVFGRFQKLDDFVQGTGLGLAISKAIVEAAGGEIGFNSEIGRGSTFWAWVPCEVNIQRLVQPADTPISGQSVQPITDKKEIKILVAEDNDSNYSLVKHILKDYDITRVSNGVEAVEKVRYGKFDFVLMDLKMPIMGGLEATRKIREFDRHIPIIALTANAFDSDRASAVDAGCSAFLAKPVKKGQLLELLSVK